MFLFKYLIVSCSLIFCSNVLGAQQSNSTSSTNHDDEFVPIEAETEEPILLKENRPSKKRPDQFSSNREVFNENSMTSVQTKNSNNDFSQQNSGSLNYPQNYGYPRGSFNNEGSYNNRDDQYRGESEERFRSAFDAHRAFTENARNRAMALQSSQFPRSNNFPSPTYHSDYTMGPLNSYAQPPLPPYQSSNFGGFSNPVPDFPSSNFGGFSPNEGGFSSSQQSVHYRSESGPGFSRTSVFGSNNGVPFGAVF
ncbi:uncharacterized protein LOC119689365 isoform X2 [Teleopsis dalmanni]|uniref:uncharacterized protein LOC119689365 isoform X2 n=1 Tax=Teleopsis dalmanni TaxID=139649 RepID=UPI0018CCC989|nr:uncharacterized protein LOC119689365 isoform X2 [Teleopsis dalmanni]